MNSNRSNTKDTVYMDMAKNVSNLSKDENTHIGCMIVAKDGTPVSWGYNGSIPGCDDSKIPHSREYEILRYNRQVDGIDSEIEVNMNKYPFMTHAEANAIYFADNDKLIGSTLYVTAYPCIECAKLISHTGISRVVITSESEISEESTIKPVDHESECIMANRNITLTVNGTNIKLSPL